MEMEGSYMANHFLFDERRYFKSTCSFYDGNDCIYPVPSDRYPPDSLFHCSILSIHDYRTFSDYPL